MTAFKPPWTRQPSDEVAQAPPSIQFTLDASQKWIDQNGPAASQVGDQVVNFYSSNLTQFVQSQRQQNSIGDISQSSRTMTLPGLDITHILNQGLETIKITVRPENAPEGVVNILTDINLDGYVAFVHHYFNPSTVAYDLIINDALALTFTFPPDLIVPWLTLTGTTVAVVIMFGPTALRCSSLHDLVNPLQKPGNGGIAGKVQPARPLIKIADGPIVGGVIPAHKDLLGYFFFGPVGPTGWGDPLNPDSYPYDGDLAAIDQLWSIDNNYDTTYPPVVMGGAVQFASATKSPLNSSGANTFAVRPNPASLVAGGANLRDTTIAHDQDIVNNDLLQPGIYAAQRAIAIAQATAISALTGDIILDALLPNMNTTPATIDPTNSGACGAAGNDWITLGIVIQSDIAYAQNEAAIEAGLIITDPANAAVHAALEAIYLACDAPLQLAYAAAQAAVVAAESAARYVGDLAALTSAEGNTDAQWQAAFATTGLQEGQTDTIVAEFYDRRSIRLATTSWNVALAPGGVLVNDRPLYWNCEIDPTVGGGLPFDLTPAKTYPAANQLGTRSQITAIAVPPVSGGISGYKHRTIQITGDVWTFGAY